MDYFNDLFPSPEEDQDQPHPNYSWEGSNDGSGYFGVSPPHPGMYLGNCSPTHITLGMSSQQSVMIYDDPPQEEEEKEEEAGQVVEKDGLEELSKPDFVMEPGVFSQVKQYIQAGGHPEQVIAKLTENYSGYAQMVNVLAGLSVIAGAESETVCKLVETSMEDMILKTFDPVKTDKLFDEEGETPGWLTEMVEYRPWRELIYRLAKEYPDCLLLNFTIKLIADSGLEGEITCIGTAAQQPDVFNKILKGSVAKILEAGEGDDVQELVKQTVEIICQSEYTCVYSCVLFQHLMQIQAPNHFILKRLIEDVIQSARDQSLPVTPLYMALYGCLDSYPKETSMLSSMLTKNALNPADIAVLFKSYSRTGGPGGEKPPPVNLLRIPQFLELVTDSLFKPGSRLNPEYLSKYVYLLAYASSVTEVWKEKERIAVKTEDLKSTIQAIEKALQLIRRNDNGNEIPALFRIIRTPCVSLGLVTWLQNIVQEPTYFQASTEMPVHFAILDEIVRCHEHFRPKVFDLIVSLLESKRDALEVREFGEMPVVKMIVDRLVNLIAKGFVLPVVKYMKSRWSSVAGTADFSIISYFVREVLDIMSPPYTVQFAELFLPLVKAQGITKDDWEGADGKSGTESVKKFIRYCKANFPMITDNQ